MREKQRGERGKEDDRGEGEAMCFFTLQGPAMSLCDFTPESGDVSTTANTHIHIQSCPLSNFTHRE